MSATDVVMQLVDKNINIMMIGKNFIVFIIIDYFIYSHAPYKIKTADKMFNFIPLLIKKFLKLFKTFSSSNVLNFFNNDK
jgi:hypothetical protein